MNNNTHLDQIYTDIKNAIGYDFKVKSRRTKYTFARYIFMFAAKERGFNYTQISSYLGKRDHTNTNHGLSIFKDLLDTREDEFMKMWAKIPTIYKAFGVTTYAMSKAIKLPKSQVVSLKFAKQTIK